MTFRIFFGLSLVMLGLLELFDNLGWLYIDWDEMWPLFLVIAGIALIAFSFSRKSAVKISIDREGHS